MGGGVLKPSLLLENLREIHGILSDIYLISEPGGDVTLIYLISNDN